MISKNNLKAYTVRIITLCDIHHPDNVLSPFLLVAHMNPYVCMCMKHGGQDQSRFVGMFMCVFVSVYFCDICL